MCEFCEKIEKEEYTELTRIRNDLGILGDMTTSIGVWAEEDDTFTLTTMLSGIFGTVNEAEVKISYCPICGRKLSEVSNND